ncbi:MAG TPA: putative zinc-binding metallopeptidase [Rhizomicrobium sp.]|nr:putative zinc-binding metallopeptidase [Rhizomicrobium sp.]
MRLFTCQACGQVLYFENVRCEHCGHRLGYLPGKAAISALEPLDNDRWQALADPESPYKFCSNYAHGVCNWMVPADGPETFCAACRHNRTIPDLSVEGHLQLWARIEAAKHRLFYSLLRLKLPLENRADNPERGLAFDFLADPPEPQAPQSHVQSVMTGHANGLITLALKEADDSVREKVRGEMGEPYRTLLGHFRHEIGHYFWDRLIGGHARKLSGFRAAFGDERADYGAALARHYAQGAPPSWQDEFVSAYAASHPWEDFAETWAHYLHIVDTLETARAFGIAVSPRAARGDLSVVVDFDSHKAASMPQLIDAWLPIAFAVNSLNRSMGQPDLYPFVLAPRTIEKLAFIHALVHGEPKAAVKKPRAKKLVSA